VAAIVLPGEAVDVWRTHRTALEPLGADTVKAAYGDLVARVATVRHQSLRDARGWLTSTLKAKEAPAPTRAYEGLAAHQLFAADVPLADADAWAAAVAGYLGRVRDRKSLDVWETQLAGLPAERRAASTWTRISVALAERRAALGGAT
jgi:hypothetical protein